MARRVLAAFLLVLGWAAASAVGAEAAGGDAAKAKVAIFPFAGSASETLRERCGFSLRAKLDRDGHYEVIDGPRMADLAAMAQEPPSLKATAQAVRELGALVEGSILIWGDLDDTSDNSGSSATLRLKILDLREPDAKPRELSRTITEPTDVRFVAEEILRTLPGVGEFAHPNEQPVQNDPQAEQLWQSNPNLVVNGDFAQAGSWEGIYQSERYPIQISDTAPVPDKVLIYRRPAEAGAGGQPNNVLAMNLSQYAAEWNGLACLSAPIAIQPNTRYRLSFRYQSEAPRLHVFIKGYTVHEDINGRKTEREIYRRQVPPSEKTDGQWVTIVDELNPQHIAFPVQTLRVDLYAYRFPGMVLFDDVVLKAVGQPTRDARDAAIKRPTSRPAGAR